LTEFLFI